MLAAYFSLICAVESRTLTFFQTIKIPKEKEQKDKQ
jgi:hypothetical protein